MGSPKECEEEPSSEQDKLQQDGKDITSELKAETEATSKGDAAPPAQSERDQDGASSLEATKCQETFVS